MNEQYILILLEKLNKAVKENVEAKNTYEKISDNAPSYKDNKNWAEEHGQWFAALSEEEKASYVNGPRKHSKAKIDRLRIELNKALIEWNK